MATDHRRFARLAPDQAIIALGSSLAGRFGSSTELVSEALKALDSAGLTVLAQSSLWFSPAWPDPRDPPFINAVVVARAFRDPEATLAGLMALEQRFDRTREGANGPRTLDLDLIAQGEARMHSDGLILPHPRAHERRFVMAPLAEIAPDWMHPALGARAADLAAAAPIGREARPLSQARNRRRERLHRGG
ncbi:MAG: 2-amino-4-hydroxy-6-hydroxymethyldihydropteridine diphosphokinase [Alphaproteobacteria bacterium]|nr:2-amino-4-hydroxy-6-hydroxymethyldihydropteridine diphosphokinase [Alphaproteobacteria bacterium]